MNSMKYLFIEIDVMEFKNNDQKCVKPTIYLYCNE